MIIKKNKPSLEEIQKYCDERNNGINANSFYNFYESKDWFIGKNKMKDWKACVRTWEQRNSKKVKDKKDIIPKWFNNSNDKKEISPESKKELEAILKKYK